MQKKKTAHSSAIYSLSDQNNFRQQKKKKTGFSLLSLHNYLFFSAAMQYLLDPLLSCTPKLKTNAKCYDIWLMLYLHLVVLYSFLGVVGESSRHGEQ